MSPEWSTEIERRHVGVPYLVYAHRERSLTGLFEVGRRWASRPHLVQGDRSLTFAEVDERSRAFAATLAARGVARGTRVLLLANNTVAWPVAFWGIVRAGGVVVLGNAWWSDKEVAHACSVSEPFLVLADTDSEARLPRGTLVAPIEGLERPPSADPSSAASLGERVVDEDDPAVILFTSGTSGPAKGAVLSHRSLVGLIHTLLHVSRRLPQQLTDDSPADVSLQTGPLFHIAGVQQLLLTWLTGGTLVFLRGRFDPGEVLDVIESERVTRWGGVPTMITRVLARDDLADRDLSSVRAITLGGSPVPVSMVEEIRRRFPNTGRAVSQIYGLSEAGGTLTVASGRDSVERPGTAGRPLPLVELRIKDPDADGVGEIQARTPMAMSGYWGFTEDSESVFLEDGWLSTGDLGRVDEDGYLYVTGRTKDLIIRGGENIASAHVEAALSEHPDVVDVAVVGLPDEDLGEVVGAAVRVRSGAVLCEGELAAFATGRLGRFEVPTRWLFVDEPFPTNASGKVDKRRLRALWPTGQEV